MLIHRLSCLAALAGLAVSATAQVSPSLPWPRTYDVIASDGGSENMIRLRDLDQDGDYNDPGEAFTFFTNASATVITVSGIQLSSTTGVACGLDGAIYGATSTSDEIVVLRDLNGDGDADDLNEASIWFSSAGNGSGIALGSAQSIAVDTLGRVLVLCANGGSPVVGIDGILMIQDVNLDGDAQDAGEAFYWCQFPNASGATNHSVPTEMVLLLDGSVIYGDIGTTGPITRGIYRAADNDLDGDANDLGEVTLYWTPTFSGVPAWYGMSLGPTGEVYVTNHGSGGRSITRVFDADASNTIGLSEEVQVYTATTGIWWDLLRRDDGSLLLLDSTPDQLLSMRDLNADFDFLDAGEVTIAWDSDSTGFPTANLRSVTIMRAPELVMNTPASLGGPLTWFMRTAEPFDLGVAFGALSLGAPIPLPPWGTFELDSNSLILFGLAISDITCQASFTLNLSNDPALIGTYGAQAWCGELSRMFFSNATAFSIQ